MRLRPCYRVSRLFLLAIIGIGSAATYGGSAQTPSGSFEPEGLRGDRAYFSQFGFESIDMVTGNLNLSFTDLVLQGNAGMRIAVVRSMNYGCVLGPARTIGLGGVPIPIEGMSAAPTGISRVRPFCGSPMRSRAWI